MLWEGDKSNFLHCKQTKKQERKKNQKILALNQQPASVSSTGTDHKKRGNEKKKPLSSNHGQ